MKKNIEVQQLSRTVVSHKGDHYFLVPFQVLLNDGFWTGSRSAVSFLVAFLKE